MVQFCTAVDKKLKLFTLKGIQFDVVSLEGARHTEVQRSFKKIAKSSVTRFMDREKRS